MKRISFLAVTLAATLFASCNKESGNDPMNGEPTNVTVKMSTGAADGMTRAQGEAVDVTDPVSFLNGYLYFVDGAQITNRVEIITSGASDNENTVLYSDLTGGSGVILKNIKSNADNVYFIGNVSSTLSSSLPASGNMSVLWALLAKIETQADATWGVVNASLYGSGTVDPPSGLPTDPKEVAFQVHPIVARIQIPFFNIDPAADNVITGFRIEGVFINNFYHSVALNGTPVAANKVAYASSATWAPDGEPYFATAPTDYTGITFDYAASGLGGFDAVNTDEYYPDPSDHDQMWVYNLFSGGEANRIIVKLSGITTSDGSTFADPQYATVKGINNGTTLSTLTGGKVYTFTGGIPIHAKNLTSTPEVEAVEVECDITIMPWTDEAVTPEF